MIFDEISLRFNIEHILTAHHLNDSLEGFLINISRGSGLDGLIGIPELNGKIKRPLIEFQKKDILEFATNKKLTWREDSSNKSNSYLRNKIRNKIITVNFSLFQNNNLSWERVNVYMVIAKIKSTHSFCLFVFFCCLLLFLLTVSRSYSLNSF